MNNSVNSVCILLIELIMARKLSVEEVMALLEGTDREEDFDPMEVVTPGSDEEMDAQYLEECDENYEFEGCKQVSPNHYLYECFLLGFRP